MNGIEIEIKSAVSLELGTGYEHFNAYVEEKKFTIEVSGWYEIEGYFEDDYYNGTGAWVTTYANVCIEKIEAYNNEGDVDIDVDKYAIFAIENKINN